MINKLLLIVVVTGEIRYVYAVKIIAMVILLWTTNDHADPIPFSYGA